MNDVPFVEDLLFLNILLYDIDIAHGNIIGELVRRSVQKDENTVRLLRYNNLICYVNNINAVFQNFRCPNCDTFFNITIQFGPPFNYMQWTSEECLSAERISNPRNSLWKAGLFRYQVHERTETVQKLSKNRLWVNLCLRWKLQRHKYNNLDRRHVPVSVSVYSDLVEEPIFICNSDPHHPVAIFIGALKNLASQSNAKMKTCSMILRH